MILFQSTYLTESIMVQFISISVNQKKVQRHNNHKNECLSLKKILNTFNMKSKN